MPVQFFLCRSARLLQHARLVSGRSLSWPLRAKRDGTLRSHGLRLRLYGVSEAKDARLVAARLDAALVGRLCRWRIVAIDGDGTLAVLVRVEGANLVLPLLRDGLVTLRGCGTKPLRAAQEAARRERSGVWRFVDSWETQSDRRN